MANKSLAIRKKNYIYLLKLYEYKFKNIKLDLVINPELNVSHGIIVSSFQNSKKITNICLNFSKNIFQNINSMRRTKTCLDYWIPLIIEASCNKDKKFSIFIDSSDEGHSDYLNMDSEYKDKLIPDLYSIITSTQIDRNFIPLDFKKFHQLWLIKKNIMHWRGSTTGNCYSNFQELKSLKRIQICNRYKNIYGFDLKITRIVQNGINKSYVQDWLISNNIFSEEIGEEEFQLYKYYPDIPGNALAWGTIRKYLFGNLVFKPYTKRKLFYYQFMQPWKDYIPVNEEFLDLNDKYKWAENNQEEAAHIAWNGYVKSHEYIKKIPEYFISVISKNKYEE